MSELERVSSYDLYFYAAMVQKVIDADGAAIDNRMQRYAGPNWRNTVTQRCDELRSAVEALIKDLSETSRAVAMVNKLFGELSAWRRLMEATGRMAPPHLRAVLMQAGGYGLGSPRTAKETKDFLLTVQMRVDALRDDLRDLDVPEEALDYPAQAIRALEELREDVRQEKQEDLQARHRLREARRKFVELFTRVDQAAKAAHAEKVLLGTPADVEATHRLIAGLQTALAEARVTALQRAKEVPPEIQPNPTVDTSEDPVPATE